MKRIAMCVRLCIVLLSAAAAGGQEHDDFDHLIEINKASLVMLVEENLLPVDLAARIAAATMQIEREQRADDARRSSNYLVFEHRLLELAGPEGSRLHTGRSRQDIGSTLRRFAVREALLDVIAAQHEARAALLEFAQANADVVIPAYTHGVQAQPTSVGHFLLAFSAAFERDYQRYRESYARINRSPLGAAALGTSGFPLDRLRLAELLGFDGIVDNSYDANLVSSVDSKVEFANAMALSALPIGQLMQNLHTQYHGPRPWFMLADAETDVSSIMPQKRNPRPIDRVRSLASGVIGNAHLVTLNAHNTNSGMNDYRPAAQIIRTASQAVAMYAAYVRVIENLIVLPERALDEINSEYSTMTEVADVLLRHADVPFRVAHHYASELTTYGRTAGKTPRELTDAELEAVYQDATGATLPIDVKLIRNAMDPQAMVANRRGTGGPQSSEVERMLAEHRRELDEHAEWLERAVAMLDDSRSTLDSEFRALMER